MKFHIGLTYNRTLAMQYKKYLARGIYVLHPNMRTYVRLGVHSQAIKAFPSGEKGMKPFLRRVVGVLFTFAVFRSGAFGGEFMYFTNTGLENLEDRECKIFSNQKKCLMILPNSKQRFDLYLQNRRRNEGLFPMPMLYSINEKEFIFVEEYIHKVHIHDTVMITKNLFEFYVDYYSTCLEKGFCKHYYKKDGSIDEKCPVLYLQHGDLGIDNFAFRDTCGKDLVFIDFEHEDYFPPFYDVFFFIFNQLLVDGNQEPLKSFNAGWFDQYLLEYARNNCVLPEDIVESCVRDMWNKRLQRYSDEKKRYIQKTFDETIHSVKQRMR